MKRFRGMIDTEQSDRADKYALSQAADFERRLTDPADRLIGSAQGKQNERGKNRLFLLLSKLTWNRDDSSIAISCLKDPIFYLLILFYSQECFSLL